MTRLTGATETFAWARDIDWSDGASAMRSGEEHFKRRKASYLKRKEEERKSGIKSIKKSPTSHGAGSRVRARPRTPAPGSRRTRAGAR